MSLNIYKANVNVWLNLPAGADVESVGYALDRGLEGALSSFPDAEVLQADVDSMGPASRDEIAETLGDEFVEKSA